MKIIDFITSAKLEFTAPDVSYYSFNGNIIRIEWLHSGSYFCEFVPFVGW